MKSLQEELKASDDEIIKLNTRINEINHLKLELIDNYQVKYAMQAQIEELEK